MDLTAVDTIILRNIRSENFPVTFMSLKSDQLFSKDVLTFMDGRKLTITIPFPINDSSIMTFDSVNSFEYFMNHI